MLTVSDLITNEYCNRKLYLKRILNLKEPSNIALIKGIIIHDSIGQVIRGIPASKALKENIKKHHIKIKEFNHGLVDLFHDTLPHIKNTIKYLDTDYSAEVQVQNNELKGRIDFMKDTVVEVKTGSPPRTDEIWPGHQLQAAAYLWMSRKQEATLIYSKTGDTRTVMWNPFLEKKLQQAINDAKSSMQSLPPVLQDTTRCEFCALKTTCHDKQKMKKLMSNLPQQTS